MASAAVRARVMVSSLVSWSRSMTCRKSSTAVSFAGTGVATGLAVIAGEGGVVDPAGELLVVLVAEQGEVIDAGGAGGVIAGQGLGAGFGVGVPGDVMRGRGPGVLPVAPYLQHGQVERVEDQLCAPPGQARVDLVPVAV